MPVKKPLKKKAATKKPAVKKKAAPKKPRMVCGVCGLAVTVDTACGCIEEHPIICCGTPMKKK